MTTRQYFAQKAFIVREGALLLVQKAQTDPHHPGKWEVPGGRMEFGEDVDDHIKREVREEVGLEIVPHRPFYIWQWVLDRSNSETPSKLQIVAVARICTPWGTELSNANRVEDDHLDQAAWVPMADLPRYELIPNMIPVLAAFEREYAAWAPSDRRAATT